MPVELAKRLITVDEYYKMAEVGILKPTDRVELINGEIINKISPSSSFHSGILKRLVRLFNTSLVGKVTIGVQDPVRLDEENEPEPDISILKFRADDYFENHPKPEEVLLLVEVSYTSLDFDEHIKMGLYASFSIPEYWIVDVEKRCVIKYSTPESSRYQNRELVRGDGHLEFFGSQFYINDLFPKNRETR